MTWDLYETKLHAYGHTKRERQLEQAREDFLREAVGNPAYHKALRNGVEEDFLITRTDKTERFKITAFPGNELNIGDYIEVWGETFLVYQTRVQDTLNVTGILWLCNHKFRWQNFDSTIIERWGILDSGVYSTTIRGEDEVKYTNKQYKMILPLDEDTRKIHLDKRFAVDKMFDRNGKEILNVYQITGYDATSENFGDGAHILYLNLRSDEYNDDTDNVEEMICDYIEPEEEITTPLKSEIVGPSRIRVGTSKKYRARFYDADENIISEDRIFNGEIVLTWGKTDDYARKHVSATSGTDHMVIKVDDDEDLIGHTFSVYLRNTPEGYNDAELLVEIVGM